MGEDLEIVEVSPRDGLQNEDRILSTDTKIELIERLAQSGAARIEAVSFVNPALVPQMADAEAVLKGVTRGVVKYAGLVLNERGLQRAIAAQVDEINYVVVATDTFGRRNQGNGTAEAIELWRQLAPRALDAGIRSTVTIGAAFGCPFEGEVPVGRIERIVERVADTEVAEICLSDTIGVAAPREVIDKLSAASKSAPGIPLRCHFHNTRNTGIANAYVAAAAGASALDSSLGGIGGCPFAPSATGNIPTEDLAYMLHRLGYSTGLNLDSLISAASWLGNELDTTVPGLLSRAGNFPPLGAPGAGAL